MLYKLMIGLAIAGLAAAYQEKLPRIEGRGASVIASQSVDLAPYARLSGHKGAVTAVASADQGRWIVSTGSDATLRVWNSGSAVLVRTIELDDGAATALAVEERRALTGHRNGAIALWDLERAEKLATFQLDSEVAGLALAVNASQLAATTQLGAIGLFDLNAPSAPAALLESQEGPAQLIAAARTANLLVAAGGDRSIRLWRTDTRAVQRIWRGAGLSASALTIAGSGRTAASGDATGTVRLWSAASSRQQRMIKAHEGRVTALAFAPSDRLLASAGDDGLVKLWDLRAGRPLRVLAAHAGSVRSIAFSADGQRIVAGGLDGIIRVFSSEPPLLVR
jgi:WD40 repeat protein